MIKKTTPKIITLIFTIELSACMSPGYQCPLHDQTRACLSELEAYKTSIHHQESSNPEASNPYEVPYVIEPLNPDHPKKPKFSWRGPIHSSKKIGED